MSYVICLGHDNWNLDACHVELFSFGNQPSSHICLTVTLSAGRSVKISVHLCVHLSPCSYHLLFIKTYNSYSSHKMLAAYTSSGKNVKGHSHTGRTKFFCSVYSMAPCRLDSLHFATDTTHEAWIFWVKRSKVKVILNVFHVHCLPLAAKMYHS